MPNKTRKRDVIQTRNELDSMVHQSEKQLSELNDQAPAELKEKINQLLGVKKVSKSRYLYLNLAKPRRRCRKTSKNCKEAMKYATPTQVRKFHQDSEPS